MTADRFRVLIIKRGEYPFAGIGGHFPGQSDLDQLPARDGLAEECLE